MKEIRFIIFDLAEVLIRGIIGLESELAAAFGAKTTGTDVFSWIELRALFEGRLSEDAFWQQTLQRNAWFGSTAIAAALVRKNFKHLIPGTVEVARDLSRKYQMALLSDHSREWIQDILNDHPFLTEIFFNRFFSFDLKSTKSEIETFRTLLRLLGVAPGECLFIDDSPQNIANAEMLGIHTIRFVDAPQLRRDLENLDIL